MGGVPKGLLRLASGEAVVDRWVRLLEEFGIRCVLVGAHDAYAPRTFIPDAEAGAGPLGGLLALLSHARTAAGDSARPWALAVACDMPHVSTSLLARLLDAPDATAVAPRREGRWEPMFARYDAVAAYDVARARGARGERSLQGLLDALGAAELPLSTEEATELDDWDTLEDVRRRPG
jgi:molybdopterin-guanine dinucleotide biosynthesis protein A